MNNASKEILVLGLGNEILMDDGIGPKLTMELEKMLKNPGISYETAAVGGMELIEMIRDYNHVIIIDAIKTQNGVPGSVYYLTPSSFKETLHISNLHDISFLTALRMANRIGIKIPHKIDIIAIEIIEDRVFGEEFTFLVQQRYHKVKSEVVEFVLKLTETPILLK
jgi:hydrogenase maturation protease